MAAGHPHTGGAAGLTHVGRAAAPHHVGKAADPRFATVVQHAEGGAAVHQAEGGAAPHQAEGGAAVAHGTLGRPEPGLRQPPPAHAHTDQPTGVVAIPHLCASPTQSPTLERSSWVPDVTQDGDVESNPGPAQSMHMDGESPQANQPSSFQELAPQFSAPPTPYSPKTVQLPDGQWFEQRPLPPPSLLHVAQDILDHPVELLFSGDGLPIPTLGTNIQVFDLSTQHLLDAKAMVGKHTFLFLPRPLPFTDTPSTFSLRSWCTAIKEAMLMQAPSPTLVTLVIQSRFDSPTPTTLPILDRRFELDTIRKFLSTIRVFPDFRLNHRNLQDGTILQDRLPTAFPLLMFIYVSTCSFSNGVSCTTWVAPGQIPGMALHEDEMAMQVILNAPCVRSPDGKFIHHTGLQLIKVLNGMDPEEASTHLRHASCLRYPPDYVPQVQRASPTDHTIAHYHVPPLIVQHLTEDTDALREVGIEWAVVAEPLNGSYIVNHQPRTFAKNSKHEAPEVRDSLLAVGPIAKLLENTILIGKWDVWIRPFPGVAIDVLAAQVRNLDNLTITDAAQLLKVQGPRGPLSVSPPSVLASFSARLLPTTVITQLSRLLPIASHQQTQRPGLLLLRMATPGVASLVYGVVLPSTHGSITLTSGSESEDTRWETSHGLGRGASWDERQPLLEAMDVFPLLSAETLLGHQASLPKVQSASSSSTSPSDYDPPGKPIASIFSKQRPSPSPPATPKAPDESSMQEN